MRARKLLSQKHAHLANSAHTKYFSGRLAGPERSGRRSWRMRSVAVSDWAALFIYINLRGQSKFPMKADACLCNARKLHLYCHALDVY